MKYNGYFRHRILFYARCHLIFYWDTGWPIWSVSTSRWLGFVMFGHPAWAVGSCSNGPWAAGRLKRWNWPDWSPYRYLKFLNPFLQGPMRHQAPSLLPDWCKYSDLPTHRGQHKSAARSNTHPGQVGRWARLWLDHKVSSKFLFGVFILNLGNF